MKIPNYIDKKLKKRTKLAEELMKTSYEIDFWLERNGFKVDEPPLCQVTGDGVMVIIEPEEAEEIVRNHIEKTEKYKGYIGLPKSD